MGNCIETLPAKYQELTFSKLFGYYGSKGIVLNERTFEKNLGLRNKDGEYNLLAQLLSDNSHFPLRVSIFEGETKGSNLFSVREFGNNCLLYTLDEVLRYRLNSRRQRIITEMRDNPNITTSELHQILGISETAVENNLTFLKENGYVERVGSKKTGYWKVLE